MHHLNLHFASIDSAVRKRLQYCLDKSMDSYNCSSFECQYYHLSQGICDDMVQQDLDAPMPWIGMYIAAASAAISIAMSTDAFYGFKSRKYWFPCKYFSLNAFSLTLLAVAMKLPVDLTNKMIGVNNIRARVSSLVLMSIAMSNFMTSLGDMDNNEIMLNLAALGMFVITITVNVFIHKQQLSLYYGSLFDEEVGSAVFMLLSLVTWFSLAIMVPTAKKYIESVYQEMHKRSVSNKKVEWGNFTIDELRTMVRRYWMMAQTGSPQFVIARSVTCVMSGVMCLLMAISLLVAWTRMPPYIYELNQNSCNYKWSILWILLIQSIGVALGTIAPVFRWIIAAKFKSSKIGHKSFKEEFRVENYWTQVLVDWRDSSFPLQIQHHKFKKLLNDAKKLVLNFCIGVQVVIVLVEKLVLLISARFVKVILLRFHKIKNLKAHDPEESRSTTEHNFSPYVVLLEGEAELPKKTLITICNEVGKLIQIGKKKQPKNLIKLLKKSVNFNGVTEFDSKQVPSLRSHQEPPNCWSLPIVTLTSIAIALPNITVDKSNELLRAVSEGLYFVKIIEKALDRNEELASIRNAADLVWVGVELYHKWQDISLKSRSYNNVLQELSDVAKKTVEDFKIDVGDLLRENPLSWPVKVIAGNSMYRISQTIMQPNKDNSRKTEEELFERLYIMISDILSACLTNIVTVVTLKCQNSVIKEREKSVSQAAVLLGESEEILKILQQRELPSLDQGKSAYIDEWKAVMERDGENPEAPISATIATNPHSNGEHISIELEG